MTNIEKHLTKKGWTKVDGITINSSVAILTGSEWSSKKFAAIRENGDIAYEWNKYNFKLAKNHRYYWATLERAMRVVEGRSFEIYNDEEPGKFRGVFLLTPAGIFKAPMPAWVRDAVEHYKDILLRRAASEANAAGGR